MSLIDKLQDFFEQQDKSAVEISQIRFTEDGGLIFYIRMKNLEQFRLLRCKTNNLGEIQNFYPMTRFNENTTSPWDTTIKDAKNIFSSFPGIGGVANRTVNRSLI